MKYIIINIIMLLFSATRKMKAYSFNFNSIKPVLHPRSSKSYVKMFFIASRKSFFHYFFKATND